jgi:hypothetical protein
MHRAESTLPRGGACEVPDLLRGGRAALASASPIR